MRKLQLLLAGLLFISACDTKEVQVSPEKLGYTYFPLEVGLYAIYDVEETTYSLTAPPSTLTYQLKEVVADTFTDLSRDQAFRIYRYSRATPQASWRATPDSVWTAKMTPSQAIRTENNVSFIKLSFPVKENLRWNGNSLNSFGNSTSTREYYEIKNLGKPFQVLDHTFDNSLTVIQKSDSNIYYNTQRIEVFGASAGLIYKEYYQVQYCGASPASVCTSLGQIDFGVKRIQRIREYGKE